DDFVDVQDIDVSRFVPQEVDHTVGITVAPRTASPPGARPGPQTQTPVSNTD
ncbi:hypothetical protein KUCAC02_031905, partial [Chaenocephalus aceratus]